MEAWWKHTIKGEKRKEGRKNCMSEELQECRDRTRLHALDGAGELVGMRPGWAGASIGATCAANSVPKVCASAWVRARVQYGTGGDCRLCRGDYKQRKRSVEGVEPVDRGEDVARRSKMARTRSVEPRGAACCAGGTGWPCRKSRREQDEGLQALRTATSPSRRAVEAAKGVDSESHVDGGP